MTTPENATTWRDLADQLSDATRFALELLEQETQGDARAKLLALARDDIETRLADAGYCDIPAPAGASVGEWEHNTAGGWSRSLVWASFGEPGGISVDIDGRQECDGTYTRRISVWGVEYGGELTSARARGVAAMLIEAADEMDGWVAAMRDQKTRHERTTAHRGRTHRG
jgi:hypothetical protein